MGFSYTFHLSAKSHAVTNTNKVAQISRHNLRGYKGEEYDRSQIEILRGNETSILDEIKEIYHREFDEALERYNTGKRSDRQIADYLEYISGGKSDVAVEIIIQVGDKDFWEGKTDEERRQMTYIFRDQIRALEKLVPEFKVASAVIHYDEHSPHMHVVGVPVAEGYKRGLEKQVGKTKVFTSDRLSYLQDKMRENAERGMEMEQNRNLFGGIKLKDKEKGRNKDIPKSSMDEYGRIQEQTEHLKAVGRDLENKNNRLKNEAFYVEMKTEDLKAYADELLVSIEERKNTAERYNEALADLTEKYKKQSSQVKELEQTVEKEEEKLQGIQMISRTAAAARSRFDVYEEDIKDGMFSSHKAVVVEGLSVNSVKRLIEAGTIKGGAVEDAKDILSRAEDEAREIKWKARNQIREAEHIISQKNEIVQDAKKEADAVRSVATQEKGSILERAREEARKIVFAAQEQLKTLEEKIKSLTQEKRQLEHQKERMISEAQIQADKIVAKAHKDAGTGQLYREINKRLGIIPQVEVMKAHEAMMREWREFIKSPRSKPTEQDRRAFEELNVWYMEHKNKECREHGWYGNVARAMRKYIDLAEAPHTVEEVQKNIEKFIKEREMDRGISR